MDAERSESGLSAYRAATAIAPDSVRGPILTPYSQCTVIQGG